MISLTNLTFSWVLFEICMAISRAAFPTAYTRRFPSCRESGESPSPVDRRERMGSATCGLGQAQDEGEVRLLSGFDPDFAWARRAEAGSTRIPLTSDHALLV